VRGYLSVLAEGRRYHRGTSVPMIGAFVQLDTGLWVPEGARTQPAPIDYARTYVTLSEITGGTRVSLDWLLSALARVPLKQAVTSVAATMAALRAPNDSSGVNTLDRSALEYFTEPARTALANRLSQGAIIHAPQLLMVLAKLIIATSPDDVPENEIYTISLAHLLLVVADNLLANSDVDTVADTVALDDFTVELVANNNFNASYRPDSQLALFQRRWIEMSHETPSAFLSEPLDYVYESATGISIEDMAAVAIALWASCNDGRPVVHYPTYLSGLGWSDDRIRRLLSYISLSFGEYRHRIRSDLKTHPLDWYFTTFSLFPVIRFGEDLVILDPELLLRRCLGFVLYFDIQDGLRKSCGSSRTGTVSALSVRQAFDDYSERYVREVFDSLTATGLTRRVYSGDELRRAFPGEKVADVAVDYGDAWVIVEVTTRQVSRDTVNAVSVRGIARDRDTVLEEAAQVASTIACLKDDESRLTRAPSADRGAFYPIVVLTEGFPSNPLIISLIREEAKSRGLLAGPNVGQLEVLDIVELDMLEGIAETGGPSIPDILRLKADSSFHADSVRNFLVGDSRFAPRRPARVTRAFRRVFTDIAVKLGGDPRLFEGSG
jgi:hypothetical protein